MTNEEFEMAAAALVSTERVNVVTRIDQTGAVTIDDPDGGDPQMLPVYAAYARVERIGFEAITKAEASYPIEDDQSIRSMISELSSVVSVLDGMTEQELSAMAKRMAKKFGK